MNAFDEILSFLQEPLGTFPDRSARWFLSNPDNLHGLLEIIGSDLVGSLDFRKIRRVNTTFVADNLREQESDLVFLLPFRDADEREVMIYILIEHQSTVDPAMGFRLLFYMVQIWDQQRQQWVSENVPKREWRFRPIIPVVFYTGE
ncbi:MAG: Rpn family recombination-promoting nuclease/putative transposase [Candidatus Poribacteria bacterium]|nr:Rpn family recombination-promoting nuclease/putative transposase [Candidatus Poribacteria bacterium]